MRGVKHIPTERTRQMVSDLYSMGIPVERIAKRLELDDECVRLHYKKELDENKDNIITELGKLTLRKALEGDDRAREFYLRTQGRWATTKEVADLKTSETNTALLSELVNEKKKTLSST